MQPPVMTKVSPNDLPIMSVSALSDVARSAVLPTMHDELLPRFQQLKGVAEITLLGGEQREVQVKVDQAKLMHYRVPLPQRDGGHPARRTARCPPVTYAPNAT